jgi:hypothetical protein
MKLSKAIISTLLISLFAACECPPDVDKRFVSDLEQVYFADSVASFGMPRIQYNFEVKYDTESDSRRKRLIPCRSNKVLGIEMASWVIADSTIITCSQNLPGVQAGSRIMNGTYYFIDQQKAQWDTFALKTITFSTWWDDVNWGDMPDTATLKFRFKLNTGREILKLRKIRFNK